MVNTLTDMRTEISNVLKAAGIKSVDYVSEQIIPPVAIVVPADPYISTPVGVNPFNAPYAVNLQILLLGPKATSKGAATQMDELIVSCLDALDDYDITEVTAPGEVTIKGGSVYSGAVLTLNQNTNITKEVI